MRRSCVGALVVLAVLGGATSAAAQNRSIPESTWRQPGRAPDEKNQSDQSFAVELRAGPYFPQVDDDFASPGPYEKAFGTGAQVYIGLEFDWLPLRIPYLGMFGPGIGWGYTATSATAKLRSGKDSGDETSLSIMPMHLSAVLRADELMRRTGVPIVPYGKFGLGFATWDASTIAGTTEVDGELGRGTTLGLHMALGGMFALNWLDPRESARADATMGINHAYIFGEWMNAMLNGLGSRPQMRVGSSTFVAGLAIDM